MARALLSISLRAGSGRVHVALLRAEEQTSPAVQKRSKLGKGIASAAPPRPSIRNPRGKFEAAGQSVCPNALCAPQKHPSSLC